MAEEGKEQPKYVVFHNAQDANMRAPKVKIHRGAASTPNKQSSVMISAALSIPQSTAHAVRLFNSPGCSLQLTHAAAMTEPVDSDVEVDEDRAANIWYDRTAADEALKQLTVLNTPSTAMPSSRTAVGAATPAAGAQHARRRSSASSRSTHPGIAQPTAATGQQEGDGADADDSNASERTSRAPKTPKLPERADADLKQRIGLTMVRTGPAQYVLYSSTHFWKAAYNALINQLEKEYRGEPGVTVAALRSVGIT